MKINLTILSVVLAFAATSAHSAVSLLDEYRFGGNLTSENGKTMNGNQAAGVSYLDDAVVIHSTMSQGGGIYSGAPAPYNVTDNWAVQIDFKFKNMDGTAAKIFSSDNSANGLNLTATNGYDGYTFALCSGGGWNGYGNDNMVTTSNLQSVTDMVKISIVNKGGNLYLFAGNDQLSFGRGRDFLTLSEAGLSGSALLGNFMLGFGPTGTGGIASGNDLTVGNLSFYTFGADDSLDDVKAGMGLGGGSVPEPTTTSLALLGLAACMLRRRRV